MKGMTQVMIAAVSLDRDRLLIDRSSQFAQFAAQRSQLGGA